MRIKGIRNKHAACCEFLYFDVSSTNLYLFKFIVIYIEKRKNMPFYKIGPLGYAMPYPRGPMRRTRGVRCAVPEGYGQ